MPVTGFPMHAEGSPYYAVVFSSVRTTGEGSDYAATAEHMERLAAQQPGFLGVESARNADGVGLTVSYWKDLASIRAWREQAEHQMAQRLGRDVWHRQYRVRVCRVEHEYGWPPEDPS